MSCKNCEKQLEDTDAFCNDCGAKVIHNRITIPFLFHEVKENMFSIDTNKPLLTYIDLYRKPDKVIGGYINGVRKKYINAFGYFTIALTLSGFFFFVFLKWFPNLMDYSSFSDTALPQEQIDFMQQWNKTFFESQAIIFFITVPVLAIVSRVVFLKNKKFNFAEHLIITLYAYSHCSITITLLYLLTIWNQTIFTVIALVGIPAQLLFYAYTLKKLYTLDLGQIILKTILFFVIFGFILVAAMILGIVFFYYTGFFDGIIEAAKTKKESVTYIASSIANWTS